MSSHPPDQTPAPNDAGKTNQNQIDETSGSDSLPKTDETSAFSSHTQPVSTERSRKKQPRIVGGYDLGDMLGQGGMGRVFRADDSTGRSVALKLLSPDLARSPDALARFKQEGLIASQINHPHCVFVHRVDDDAGTPFIAMELMTGQTLKDLVLQNGPLPYMEAVRLILQCVDGLIEAHSLGMIHRDIKPANCYLDEDRNVKIGDFGLARSLVSDSELTQTGAFLGTPLFASPEQLLGQTVDARSDIYSLSATLYYLLAGKAPFESPHAAQVIARIASSDPPSFSSAGVKVPPALERIVMKGLSRDASKRYASFVEMRNDLQTIVESNAEPTSLFRRSCAWLLDYFIMTSIIGVLMVSFTSLKDLQEKSVLTNLFGTIFVFCYYLLCESIFAATFGKAALRVKVVDARTGGKPHFLRILVRAAFTIFLSSALFLLVKVAVPDMSPSTEGILVALTFFLNIVFHCSTWWHTKKRQLSNDWISGTECRTRIGLRATVRSAISLPKWDLPVRNRQTTHGSLPSTLGRFEITGEIDCHPIDTNVRWLTGRDQQLDRAIWVAYLTDPKSSFDARQNHKQKNLRLRFIEEGSTPECRWFAFVAPDAIPVWECAKQGIQFPWPITRSILGDIVEIPESTLSTPGSVSLQQGEARNGLDANQMWVDSAGRLTQTDFQCTQAAPINVIPLVSKLGLPTRHRLRKTLGSPNSSPSNIPIESLPPLRAIQLLERVGSQALSPTSTELKQMLERVDKQSHELSPSLRFVSAAASLGLMSPAMFFAVVMLIVPSVVLIMDGMYREIRKLRSLALYVDQPERFSETWAFASGQEKTHWSQPGRREEIQEALAIQTDRLKTALKRVGSLERGVIANIPSVNLDSPPIFGKKDKEITKAEEAEKAKTESVNNADERIKISAGPMNVIEVNFDEEQVDSETLKSILGSVERSKELPKGKGKIPDLLIVGIGIGVCILWTTLTFGGITKHFTGICFRRRDGRHLGIMRSFWRAILIYAPFLLLTFLISYCNSIGYEYLGWGTILKRVFIILPLVYLVSALVWYRRTPLDLLSDTVAIPR